MLKPGLRKPRFTRSSEFPPLHLTERDVRILALFERHRFASSRHVAQMIGGSAQHLTRRLGRLYHAGLLQRPRAQLWLSRNSNARMVCCITGAGQAILRERGLPTYASPPRARGETMALSLSHSLCVTDVMLALERSAIMAGHRFLYHDEWREDNELKINQMRWGVGVNYDGKRVRTTLMPDGAFATELTGKRSYFVIEVDRGTMPVSRSDAHQSSFRRKVLAYKATRDTGILWKRHGVSAFRVLVVSESPRRAASLRSAAAATFRHGLSSMFLFATADELLTAACTFHHSWMTCDGATRPLFTDRNASPYSTNIL